MLRDYVMANGSVTEPALGPASKRELLAKASALISRYGALVAQFVIVVLVARHLPKAEAGTYLLVFSVVTTTSVFAGVGAPDGLVKSVPELIHAGALASVKLEVRRAGAFTALTSLALLTTLVFIGAILEQPRWLLLAFALWWCSYATVFFCGQALVALARPRLGAFVFYALNNLLLIFTTAPALITIRQPDAMLVLTISILASWIAAVVSTVLVVRTLRVYTASEPRKVSGSTYRLGFLIAAARVFQSTLYWIPAWLTAIVRGPADAATVSAAGRLLIAATAVIAVFRFTLRGQIVTAMARNDHAAVERMARSAATISTICAVGALFAVLTFGQPIIRFVFGPGYHEVPLVLAVLLVGAVGESIGGPVDEVLKYSGHAVSVLIGLVVTAVAEAGLALVLAPHGPIAVAISQASAFCGMYTYQIVLLRKRHGLLVLPYLRGRSRSRIAIAALSGRGDG